MAFGLNMAQVIGRLGDASPSTTWPPAGASPTCRWRPTRAIWIARTGTGSTARNGTAS